MSIQPGNKATAQHFNTVADKVNKIFADKYPSTVPESAILSTTGDGVTSAFSIGSQYTSSDFIIVIVDDEALVSGWSLNSGNIVFGSAPATGSSIKIRDRTDQSHGWGGPAVGVTPNISDLIEGSHVNALINRSNIMSDRSNTGVGFNTVDSDTVILATDLTNIDNYLENVIFTGATRFHSEFNESIDDAAVTTRTDPWSSMLIGIFDYEFVDYASARHFFNAGNDLKVDVNVTQDTVSQFNWELTSLQLGDVLFNYNHTRQTGYGGISNNKGFYHLTTEWQTIFTSASPYEGGYSSYGSYTTYGNYGSYTSMTIVLSAKYIENTNGTFSVLIRVEMDNSMYSSNVVTGETEMRGGYVISETFNENGVVFESSSPTVTIDDGLNSPNDS